jgi:hypothetical protein
MAECIFINKISMLFNTYDEYRNNKKIKIKIIKEIFELFDKNIHLIFNTSKYKNFKETLHKKLHEFKNEKELTKICNNLLEKHYGEEWSENRCNAYTLQNCRCKNMIISKKYYCKIHDIKFNKIFNLLVKYIIPDVTTKCIHLLI